MNDIIKINVNQIVSVTIKLKVINRNYEYRKGSVSKFLWWRKVKLEGFYNKYQMFEQDYISKEKIEEDKSIYVEGENVYYKPYLLIRMSNNQLYQSWAESEELLLRYIEKELVSIKLVNL